MACCKTFALARLSYKQLMCQQVQKKHTLYSLVLTHNIQAKFTCRRLNIVLAEVWYTSFGKSSSCAAPLRERTEAEIDTMWRSIEDFTLSVENLLLPWRSTGIDLAFYY
jgi:hypothetical protein